MTDFNQIRLKKADLFAIEMQEKQCHATRDIELPLGIVFSEGRKTWPSVFFNDLFEIQKIFLIDILHLPLRKEPSFGTTYALIFSDHPVHNRAHFAIGRRQIFNVQFVIIFKEHFSLLGLFKPVKSNVFFYSSQFQTKPDRMLQITYRAIIIANSRKFLFIV